MSKYSEFLPELNYMPMFRGLSNGEIISLLDAMQPELTCIKAGEEMNPSNGPDLDNDTFCICLRGKPFNELPEILDIYANNSFGEAGMMMAEIPVLSQMKKSKTPRNSMKKGMPPHTHMERPFDMYLLRFTPDMISKFYGEDVAPAQGKFLVNFLGLLAQKVTNVRKEKAKVQEQLDEALAKLN